MHFYINTTLTSSIQTVKKMKQKQEYSRMDNISENMTTQSMKKVP